MGGGSWEAVAGARVERELMWLGRGGGGGVFIKASNLRGKMSQQMITGVRKEKASK